MSVDIEGGSYTNFKTSKYVEEVIEVDELDEGNIWLKSTRTYTSK